VGNAYLKLTVKNIPGLGPFAPMIVSSSQFDFNPGFAFNARPANLIGKRQYQISAGDTAYILVEFFKWNATQQQSEIIGFGSEFLGTNSATTWTNFSVPITYIDGSFPDSALIFISLGGDQPVLNDNLSIDELGFSGSVAGIEELPSSVNISIHPNPFNTETFIDFGTALNNATIKIMDGLGREVKTIKFSGTQLKIEKSELKEGIYYVQMEQAGKIFTKKLIVQ